MTDREIRIAIAEAYGWRIEQGKEKHRHDLWDIYRPNGSYCITGDEIRTEVLPKYDSDLNVMHEVESNYIERAYCEQYAGHLYMVLDRDWTPDKWSKFTRLEIDYAFTHATARQRAEAFLRTIGKWHDA